MSSFLENYKENPKTLIAHAWYFTLLIVFVGFIVAIAAAAQNDAADDSDNGAGFAAIWSMLLAIALGVGGTLVMRKYPSPIMVGFLLGLCSGMSELQLLLFVVFQHYVETADDSELQGDQALAAFNFLLFVSFGLFACILYYYKDSVVIATTAPSGGLATRDENVGSLPPAEEPLDNPSSNESFNA